jgi:glycosyltransferase involved in cell wall biosynthesis
MRVAYATEYDPRDITQKSGSGFYMMKSLRAQSLDIRPIGPLHAPRLFIPRVKRWLSRNLLGQEHLVETEWAHVRSLNRQVARGLNESDADLVFSSGIRHTCLLECRQPIVVWHDATYAGLIDYHPRYCGLSKSTVRRARAIDQLMLDNCALAVFASEWAARTALDNYRVDSSKIKVVPFGANMEGGRSLDEVEAMVDARPRDRCKLLFVGVDWIAKGGPVALGVAEELNRRGLRTELTVVGCEPVVKGTLPDFVRRGGVISKASGQGMERLGRLYAESHFLILPTRAECFGIVFAESSSFGVPSLAPSTGGIPTAIRDGSNGKLFSPGAEVSEYCSYIIDLLSARAEYKRLALSAFDEYQKRLNWTLNAKLVAGFMENVARGRGARPR